jgi:hypothetical protein
MPGERYVVLGLAHARADWFRLVGQWANSAFIPVEFVKCVSVPELAARLGCGQPFSAVLVDAGAPGLDRDLVDRGRAAGCPVLVVADGRVARDWTSLGVSALLPFNFTRDQLLDALAQHAVPIGRSELLPHEVDDGAVPLPHGRVVAVCGPGGTGASTAAIALAQGLTGDVVLADFRLHAEQAMLHDARDIAPGVQELVDAHRAGQPTRDEVRGLTFDVVERQYHLLLGLRRARFWSTLRPRAFESALTSLAHAYDVVVCDVDADLEGEDEGGSIEVEERNLMARTVIRRADLVVAVGTATMKGLHSLVRVTHDLVAFGVPADRIQPVINQAPRAPRARATLTRAFAELARLPLASGAPSPVFLPERRVDEALHDGVRLPAAVVDPLRAVCAAGLRPRELVALVPTAVEPGSLATWTEPEGAPS